jgi:hypothetical protein
VQQSSQDLSGFARRRHNRPSPKLTRISEAPSLSTSAMTGALTLAGNRAFQTIRALFPASASA